jgi:hypothetical protein
MTRIISRSLVRRSALAACAALLFSQPALSDSPAAIPSPGDELAQASFERFAQSWMAKVRRLAEEQQRKPTVRPGAGSPLVTYRNYGDDFDTELRPTGHPSAPYVGILRYTENLYSCSSLKADDCTIASTVPVTEIFRFQDGRWVY